MEFFVLNESSQLVAGFDDCPLQVLLGLRVVQVVLAQEGIKRLVNVALQLDLALQLPDQHRVLIGLHFLLNFFVQLVDESECYQQVSVRVELHDTEAPSCIVL